MSPIEKIRSHIAINLLVYFERNQPVKVFFGKIIVLMNSLQYFLHSFMRGQYGHLQIEHWANTMLKATEATVRKTILNYM